MFKVLVVGAIAFSSLAAMADSAGTSATSLRNVIQNKKFSEDKRITDMELRAQAGSLSRYSMKFDMSYYGPPVGNLSDARVPNPDNRPFDDRTNLAGYVGLRYRLNPNAAVSASTGLKWFTPVQAVSGEKVEKGPGAKEFDLTNPQVSFDRTYPAGPFQLRSSVKSSLITAKYYLDRGQYASLGFSQGAKYSVNRFTMGMVADVDFYGFNREYRRGDGRVSNYYISFIPSLEYRLTDRLNLRTSVGYSLSNMRLKGSWWLWEPIQPTARAGLGWAITREIYFNPYLNFFWERPAWTTTSLSFSTVFSIF